MLDQLEEIFTLTLDSKVRDRFDTLLANALTDQDGPLHLITTIRSDFMMRFSELPRLQGLLADPGRYFLKSIDDNGLRDVVHTPARLAGLCWSDDLLPDDIIKEARGEAGALPLVENLLRLLWSDVKNSGANELSRKLYNDLGGVGGALAKSADNLLESLGKGRENALNLLRALVNAGGETQDTQDTRRTITKNVALTAAGGGQQAEEILNQLSGLRGVETFRGAPARPRLIVLSKTEFNRNSTDLVDLAHETLLRYNRENKPFWPTLRDEVSKKRKSIENRQLAEALAKDWRDNDEPRWRGLSTRAQSKAFRHLRDLSADASRYVDASLRLIRLQTVSVTTIVLITMISLSFLGWISARRIDASLGAKLLLARIGIDALSPRLEMVPAGTFRMGDIDRLGRTKANDVVAIARGDEVEPPVQLVTIHRPFAIGRYEVTFDEYDQFAQATNRQLPDDKGWGRERRPVINVSWEDANAYAKWLSEQTGKRYRLPTEAEWEYAARAGTETKYWWGNELIKGMANCNGCGSQWDGKQTAPVGSFKANRFGLYNTVGNVWEWIQDCYDLDNKGAPLDGSAWQPKDPTQCGQVVLRGGSWNRKPENMSASDRTRLDADTRTTYIGFRLAQDLE